MENKIKILLVDDEDDFRNLLGFWLSSKGYEVIPATNGQQAVSLARERSPDIIFMDLNMPVLDGTDALVQIRGFNKNVPVIIISAFVDDKKAKQAMDAGVSGVFFKGSDFQVGMTLLEAALRTHKDLKK